LKLNKYFLLKISRVRPSLLSFPSIK